MQQRERLFFGIPEMTAWKFVGINALTLLSLLHDKKELHGKLIQHLIWKLFGEVWTSGNDLTYTVLNTYEKEGYVKSHWMKDPDAKKKSLRYYHITDLGKRYLDETKASFVNNLSSMAKIIEQSLEFIWHDKTPQDETKGDALLSSLTFTSLNVMNLLYRENLGLQFPRLASSQERPKCCCLYAQEIRDVLNRIYDGLWRPSDGVIYPMLSEYEKTGLVSSNWAEGDPKKKRTVRCFAIEQAGEDHFKELISHTSGIKNKLIQLQSLCQKSSELVAGNSTANTVITEDCVQKALAN